MPPPTLQLSQLRQFTLPGAAFTPYSSDTFEQLRRFTSLIPTFKTLVHGGFVVKKEGELQVIQVFRSDAPTGTSNQIP